MPKTQKAEPNGPKPSFSLPIAQEGAALEIVFGHSTEIRKVLMQFNALTGNLVLTPEDARDIAKKLGFYADLAEGKKAM